MTTTIDAAWAKRAIRAIRSKIDFHGKTMKVPAGKGVTIFGDHYTGQPKSNQVLTNNVGQLLDGLVRRCLELDGLGWPNTKFLSRLFEVYNGIDEYIYLHDGGEIGGEGHGLYEAWCGDHTLRYLVAERMPSQIVQASARHWHVPKGGTKGWRETLYPHLFEQPSTHLIESFYCKDWGWGSRAAFAFSFKGTETQDPVNYPIGPHGAGIALRNGVMKNDAKKLGADSGVLLAERRPFVELEDVRFEVESTNATNTRPLIFSDGTKRFKARNVHFRCSTLKLDKPQPGEVTFDQCDGGMLLVINGKKHVTMDKLQQPFVI